jgi:hypothetical protein
MTDSTDDNNVTDFVVYKMRELIEFYASEGDEETAFELLGMLNQHIQGWCKLGFEDNWPIVIDGHLTNHSGYHPFFYDEDEEEEF